MKYALSCLIAIMISAAFIPLGTVEGSELTTGMAILPTPKMIELTEKRFPLSDNRHAQSVMIVDNNDRKAVIAAQEINERIQSLGGQPLPTVTDAAKAGKRSPGMNIIRLAVSRGEESGDIPREIGEDMNIVFSKGEQGYVIRFYHKQDKRTTAFLWGTSWEGLLHASSTFCLLLKKEGATIFATEAQISDWPDFKNRGLPVWPLPGSFDDFKKYVDWAFQYKFNRIYTSTTRTKTADGFNLPTYEERKYLKKINAYAKERGITINYALTWAAAPAAPGGNNDEYRDTVLFNNQYYSWSSDGLIKKRALEIAQFAKETEAGSLLFHCIDTYEEGWDKRGENDRARFGDDRAAADANVINIYTRELRRTNPGIELQFVVYPYHANLDLAGNERYKAWMTELTSSIPGDVYLAVAELNRDQTNSWVAIVKQPLAHWINGNAFQWGRYFSTFPAFTKTAYYQGRDRDIIIHWEPIGHFNGEVMQLVAAEYEWNVHAPGSGQIVEERTGKNGVDGAGIHYRAEMVNGADIRSWAWFDGTKDPAPASGDILLKACRIEFGDTAAPFMTDFFKNNPIGWRSPGLFSRILQDTMAVKELDACSDQLTKTNNALMGLKQALKGTVDSTVRARLNALLKNTYQQDLVITGATAYYKAMKPLGKNLNSETSEELTNGRVQLAEIKQEMERQGIWSSESSEWFEAGDYRLRIVEAGLNKGRSINRIENPGFEQPRDPSARNTEPIPHWISVGSVELTKDSHRGEYAAHATLRSSDSYMYMEQVFAVPEDCEGYVEFWMKKDGEFRVIPILQYGDENQMKKTEQVATDSFPFSSAVENYEIHSGTFHLPPHVTQAIFKIHADWYGFTPAQEKNLYLDDIYVGCVATQ